MTHSLEESIPGHTPEQWASDFLRGVGAPATPGNVGLITALERLESGGGGGLYNPLNSVQGAPGASNLNSVGVKNYTSYQQGLQASIATFTQTQWGDFLRGLKADNQQAAQDGLNREYATWGGGPLDLLSEGPAGPIGPTSDNITSAGPAGPAGPTGPNSNGTGGSSSGCPEGNLIHIRMPSIIPNIDITRCQGRAMLGAFALTSGTLLIVVGLGFVAIGGKTGQQVAGLVGAAAKAGAAA